ncbi:MAG: NADH:ubiquinone reductase (Na(+)-transporting) subunit D [Nitrospira sp.]|nr:NADH:ubiquinone reductase (Na(+)-transporting) subunit D [bacterium]MBL7048093.1 NADH:ubiquinone reductase (Na(+)-transporting) subunit D [Nitrospira sp.]
MPIAGSNKQILTKGLWIENPVLRHVLGICSTLAVTNLVINTLVMCAGLIFTLAMSCITVSAMRNYTPDRIRMMVQMLIISSYVIIVDILIKAYLPEISVALGPYVGLIITNCIVMGRCEAFARQNPPIPSMLDGLGTALGYSLVLLIISVVRETLGFGSIMGFTIMPDSFERWTIMIMAPGAFFMLGIFIWIVRARYPHLYEEKS